VPRIIIGARVEEIALLFVTHMVIELKGEGAAGSRNVGELLFRRGVDRIACGRTAE
jgi:hypothetical protein